MIIDAHAHIFPPLETACGFPTEEEHLRFMQLYIATHGEPARRLRDHQPVHEAGQVLSDGVLTSFDSLNTDVNFRVGPYGRFEWDWQGETYYRQYFPPNLQKMVSPPEFMLQEMGRAGVDRVILQNARPYGRLNQEFGDAVKNYPHRFIGLADVKEPEAHTERELTELRRAVNELGLRGVYYASRGMILDGYEHAFDDPKFEPFWEEVRSLGIPVFWEIQGVPAPTRENYLREIDRLNAWCEKYPTIPAILTHGIAPQYLSDEVPEPIEKLLAQEQMIIEVLYPIHWGREHDYPFHGLKLVLDRLYNMAGPNRLAWGSDMPNVERNCTYKQSLDYLPRVMDSIASEDELEAILGGNIARLVNAD